MITSPDPYGVTPQAVQHPKPLLLLLCSWLYTIFKEFLTAAEHEELLALVDFVHKRTIEKLEAQTALARLRTAIPGVLPDP